MTTLPLWPDEPSEDGLLTRDNLFTTPTSDISMRRTRYAQGGTALGMQVSASLPAATPASHSLSPGSDWARKMTATSGRTLLRSLPISGPVGACLRTLLDTSRWGSTACWLTWKKSATPAGRWLYRLVPSTPRTGAIGFGLWPTPNVNSLNNRQEYETAGGDGLQTAVRRDAGILEPTETVPVLWPTSMPSDVMGGRTTKGKDRPNETGIRRMVVDPSREVWTEDGLLVSPTGMALNPAWVSRLMGYPDHWLDLDPIGKPASRE
jgi:hypothetical protein